MDGYAGRDITLTWNAVELLGVRSKGITLNGEPIDVTSDENNGWRRLLTIASQDQVDLSISGVTKDDVLRDAWFNNRTAPVVITFPDTGGVISGTFYLSNYVDTGPYNDATTFEATLMSSGVVSYTPSSS